MTVLDIMQHFYPAFKYNTSMYPGGKFCTSAPGPLSEVAFASAK